MRGGRELCKESPRSRSKTDKNALGKVKQIIHTLACVYTCPCKNMFLYTAHPKNCNRFFRQRILQKPIRKIPLKWNNLCFSSHRQHHVGKTTKILEYNRAWQYNLNFICPQLSIAMPAVSLTVYWDMYTAGHKNRSCRINEKFFKLIYLKLVFIWRFTR